MTARDDHATPAGTSAGASADAPGRSPLDALADCRAEIARIDHSMLELLAQRVRLGRRVGALKRAAGLPVLDPTREAEVIRAIATTARDLDLPSEPVRDIYWRIIALARQSQVEEGEGQQ